jgi:hypothetical protein
MEKYNSEYEDTEMQSPNPVPLKHLAPSTSLALTAIAFVLLCAAVGFVAIVRAIFAL